MTPVRIAAAHHGYTVVWKKLPKRPVRRVLVNHARDRAADTRGGGAERVSLTFAEELFEQPQVDVLAIPDALDRLQVGSKCGAHGRNRSSPSASRICRAAGRSGRPT